MTPIVFINCKSFPYVDLIISGMKLWETRNRDTLGRLAGQRVYIAETGKGKPKIRCTATIHKAWRITDPYEWEHYRDTTCVPVGSKEDWNDETKSKCLYYLSNVHDIGEFIPPEGIRHGRTWMEYED